MTNNVTFTKDGTTVTVYTAKIKYNLTKTLKTITPAQGTSNWASGPKDTLIIDLLRIEERFTITGHIVPTDEEPLKNMAKAGGVITMNTKSTDFTIGIDKMDIEESPEDEATDGSGNDLTHRDVIISCVKGVNLGGV